MKTFYVICLILPIIFAGCVAQQTDLTAADVCVKACEAALNEGTNLSAGPCLDAAMPDGWVCDVVHEPREAVDNLPENQCEAYRNGTAGHFVEVDAVCKIIRAA